jgi:hypothetical protein
MKQPNVSMRTDGRMTDGQKCRSQYSIFIILQTRPKIENYDLLAVQKYRYLTYFLKVVGRCLDSQGVFIQMC